MGEHTRSAEPPDVLAHAIVLAHLLAAGFTACQVCRGLLASTSGNSVDECDLRSEQYRSFEDLGFLQ